MLVLATAPSKQSVVTRPRELHVLWPGEVVYDVDVKRLGDTLCGIHGIAYDEIDPIETVELGIPSSYIAEALQVPVCQDCWAFLSGGSGLQFECERCNKLKSKLDTVITCADCFGEQEPQHLVMKLLGEARTSVPATILKIQEMLPYSDSSNHATMFVETLLRLDKISRCPHGKLFRRHGDYLRCPDCDYEYFEPPEK